MWLGILCGLLAGALWGMVFLVPQLLPTFSPWELAFGRYLAYGLIALALMLPRLRSLYRQLTTTDCYALLRHALSGNILYYTMLAFAVKLAGVGPTSLIIGLLPISVTVLGRQTQQTHQTLPFKQLLLPLTLVAAGIICINLDLFSHVTPGTNSSHKALGVLFAIGALACWTWYAIDNARYLKRHPHFSSSQWSALYGIASGLMVLLLALATWAILAALGAHDAAAATAAVPQNWLHFWIVCAVLALGASVIGNNLWNIASRLVPITLSGQLIVFETLFALLYGFVYEQRWPRALEWSAIALLIVGVVWAMRTHAEHAAAARQ